MHDPRRCVLVPLVSLALATGCYSYSTWLVVERGGTREPVVFSQEEERRALELAGAIAERAGLTRSRTVHVDAFRPRPENPFRMLGFFQGTGPERRFTMTVELSADRSALRFWITDFESGSPAPAVRALMDELRQTFAREFPDRRLTIEHGRKLRLFGA